MTSIGLGICAALGTYLLLPRGTADPVATNQRRAIDASQLVNHLQRWLLRSGLDDVSPRQFLGASFVVGIGGALIGWLVFAAAVPAVVVGLVASTLPATLWRRRAIEARMLMMEAWPRMIDEIRVRVGSSGQPIPRALLDTGLAGPEGCRAAFQAARRQWNLTTDFASTLGVLKAALEDPTTDLVCETLLVVHEVGGDLDQRLVALGADRRTDLRYRREASARAAGARFARWFVLVVPAGMAFAGLNLGEGRSAYGSASAQGATAIAVAMVGACWWWAGRLMDTPTEQRVFDR